MTKWEVKIGQLPGKEHRILTSYCLTHARSFIVLKRRSLFEKARKELKKFAQERAAEWKRKGIRVQSPGSRSRQHFHRTELQPDLQPDQLLDRQIKAFSEIFDSVLSRQPIARTKESYWKCWVAFQLLGALAQEQGFFKVENIEGASQMSRFTNPGALLAFEASYPPKPEGRKDLLDIDFNGVLAEALGEESFARIFHDVDEKLCKVIGKDDFSDYFEAGRSCFSTSPLLNSELESRRHEEDINDIIHIQSFREAYRAAVTFDVVI